MIMSSKKVKNLSDKHSDFGQRLKEVFNNSSNQAIAEKLGVSSPAITAYMQSRMPPSDKLIEIAKLTECNLNWLLTGKGNKFNTPKIERPQGIVVQGTKGGIGTSTSAVMIASTLALKGFGVLIADDVLNTCSHILLANHPKKEEDSSSSDNFSRYEENYISARHKNLDFFIPSFWDEPKCSKELIKKFDLDYAEINKKYQFVIFDVQRMANPFEYPHHSSVVTFSLEPILRNAQILLNFQPLISFVEQVESSLYYIERQKTIYPDANLLGAFITHSWQSYKKEDEMFIEAIAELREAVGSKLFDTEIRYYKELKSKYYKDVENSLYSRKTRVFHNFSQLVDEMLDKLGFKDSNLK
jgi:transcriptional regulator with XRE-family HTH domain